MPIAMLLQGHTKDVDTALVTTSEVTDYPMILLLGIGYVSRDAAPADAWRAQHAVLLQQ